MSTKPIEQTVQGYTYRRSRKTVSDSEFPLGPEQSKNRRDEVASSGAVMRGYLRDLLSSATPDNSRELAFVDIEARYDDMLKTWNDEVEADLESLGVDTSAAFRLHYDSAGSATVIGEHPDREMINAYFSANPDKVEQLGRTLQFGKLVATAKNRLSEQDMNRTLSTDAMAWWYSTNMNTQDLFAPGGIVVGAGFTPYKGLDIRV
ncbi:hypothetical protein LF599_12770 [Pseudodesulfovibrio thermohalotolerans]|uniref:hypothetical protein n=1 Tax=Pseudodesulfovibrio thermohalotolerans TaxID=2880651 RepID=UPI00244130F2|nr:hypothetical protein [Pseudodesulfovibrio thermohalotolerans]WFS61536.1 hypothetical protein LF599_12770 [Pseudodesulfovibrio thermohalotolerans]